MSHISQLFYDAVSDTTCPESPRGIPIYDRSVHILLGTLPLVFRRAIVLLQNLSENTPLDLEERSAFDHDLNQGYALLHKGVAEFFDIEPVVKVVICQGWIATIAKNDAAMDLKVPTTTTQCPSGTNDLNYCRDLASY